MKIVILDGYTENPGDLSWEAFNDLGEVFYHDRVEHSMVKDLIKDANIILTNKMKLGYEELESAVNLKYIGVLATGYDVVDVNFAKEKGIVVSNIPTYGTDSVAQMTFALILEIYNQVGLHNNAVKAGQWSACPDFCFWKKPLTELAGKTLGIIGFGRIGRQVSRIALAFGMKVLAYDNFKLEGVESENFSYEEKQYIFEKSDIVTLHCNLTDENRGFINKNLLIKMKETAVIINTSRGGLIDEKDLLWAVKNGIIAGAALDVIEKEPMLKEHPFLQEDKIIITPHISWATYEARKRLMDIAIDNARAFIDGKPKNVVN